VSAGAYVVVGGRGRDGGRFAEQLAKLGAVAVVVVVAAAIAAVPLPVAVAVAVVVAVLVTALPQVLNGLLDGGIAHAPFQRTEAGVLAAQADELLQRAVPRQASIPLRVAQQRFELSLAVLGCRPPRPSPSPAPGAA